MSYDIRKSKSDFNDTNTNIIDYIKTKYPRVIFKPFKLEYKNAIGFIISNNKLIIGFVNNSGNLCKLAEPIDLEKFTKENIADIIEKLPIVTGFTQEDKISLLRLFKKETQTQIATKDERDQLIQELRSQLEQNSKEYQKYKVMYDSTSNEIITIKAKYEDDIKVLNQQLKIILCSLTS